MISKQEIAKFAEEINCRVSFDEDMFRHTTFKTGGKADIFFVPNDKLQIKQVLSFCRKNNVPLNVIGRGSNILVKDEGIRGAVMLVGKNIADLTQEGKKIICGSGADLGSVCLFAQSSGLSGIEFAYGIPGSVGGAIFMNAGAYGGEMKDVVESAECIDEYGSVKVVSAKEMQLTYRTSIFHKKGWLITSVTFSLQKGDKNVIQSKMMEILNKRKSKQPLNFPSAGSTFKRPEGAYAAQLIDECGLKGCTVGGAQVSEKHAGFIINKGGATSADILNLVEKVKTEVKDKTGYCLECEVKII